MDEKDKFDGTEKIEEEEEKVYIARHAKKDEEDRFADIENFDVDNTETVENKEVEKNSNDVPNNEPAIDSTENFDVHSDNYGDDFDCQSVTSKNHIPSDNPKKSNRDYGDGFDAQTGEDRHEFKRRQPNNDDYYENNADTDDYSGKPKKQKKAKKQNLQKIEQTMKHLEMLYEGKAKQVFLTDDPDMILIHYKDAATAFNNIKKATIENKGVLNNRISTLIFEYLNKQGIKTHYVKTLNDRDQLCRRVRVIPLEVIVRNVIAGSMAQRLGIEEGTKPSNVIFDICYKNDELGDPLINDHHAVALGVVTYDELKQIYAMTARINEVLKELFAKMNINLIDFKIEFGRTSDGEIVLADEVSPDTCRLWDMATNEKLDKDRFRRDLGKVREAYEEILARLQKIVG